MAITRTQLKRARNIILGKHGASAQQIVSFVGAPDASEKVNTLELVDLTTVPFFCPKCESPLKSVRDKIAYKAEKMCSRCYAASQDDLKIQGIWDSTMTLERQKYLLGKVRDDIKKLEEYRHESVSFGANGDIQTWTGDTTGFINNLIEYYREVEAELADKIAAVENIVE